MAVAATGFFDGVHLGHRSVIETLSKRSCELGEQSLVVTFTLHPRVVLQSDARELRLLSSREEKLRTLQSLGVDRIVEIPFTPDFHSMTTASYLDFLKREYDVNEVVLGYDNRIGSDLADPQKTAALAREKGMGALIAPPLLFEGAPVSSTRIRKALSQGLVEQANAMLGGEYSLKGAVVGGKMLGRTIGFPTANLRLYDPLKLVPRHGVYLSRVRVQDEEYYAMTNIAEVIETHIFDFSRDIYGLDIKVSLLRRLRDEMSFAGVEELKNQLQNDEICAKKIIFER